MKIREKLGKEILFFDGAMGTELQSRGLQTGEIPETWNILQPEKIKQVHKEYLRAGANVISANTFGVNSFKCRNMEYSVEQLVSAGINLVKESIAEVREELLEQGGKEETLPTMYTALDIGSLGKLLKPLGEIAFDQAYEAFKEIIIAGDKAGADVVLIETVSDSYEIKAAVLAAKENCDLPVVVTMIFDENGKLLTGGDVASVTAMLEGLGVDAIGFNCGLGPEQMLKLLPELTACCSIPIVINPNAGLPSVVNGKTVFDVEPEEFAQKVKLLVENGASAVGGCCGTTPAHIREVISVCKGLELQPITDKNLTVVSSYNHAVYFTRKPLIIGERINPTGKSKFKQALRDHDMEYIYKEGLTQEEKGAHILDVNVGLPEIDEPQLMEEAVTGIQAIIDLPLQIDTSDPVAMERALRCYNGKPMLNSVNGKKESMESVFPIAKKYGAVVVCLCLDENGIPETVEGRLAIAEKIVKTAESYGIPKKNLVMDALVMTISTGKDNALVTLEALRRIRYEMGIHTVLGVSNISFGLPERGKVNTTFFTMALQNGLSAGIVNPSSEPMMAAYYSFNALIGEDDQCMEYIEKCGTPSEQPKVVSGNKNSDLTLDEAIIKGLTESAYQATMKLLSEGNDSLTIINEKLIPALDVVGKGFEEKKMFLPQLLMSADAAKASFEAIKKVLSESGKKSESKGKIVIATVKGDIHDIGKNIVKTLLENYGFEMIDLGKDVEPELILKTVQEQNVRLVGLSALMTTTVVNMEETIKLLREQNVNCRVMVGGAVLTQEYADMIGADFYSKDAMGSVRYANELYDAGEI
ncbi:MAG: homocysteine S-methyltransferase family protein [Lachnospiraceae bacterium]|nr:homocysteine S-methyltransferase family protein [Lachnospiraceae bacterium]